MGLGRAALVLAAGKGTRMKSATAKVLHRANGRPLVAYPIASALELGASPVVVVVGHQADAVKAEIGGLFPGAPLRFAVQEQQRGTAHAVLCGRRALGGAARILILYGDVPLLTKRTLDRLLVAGSSLPVAFLTMDPRDPAGYGRVVRDGEGRVQRIVEHRDASEAERAIRECNAGIYDCDAAFLWRALRRIGADNAQGELYLTDVVAAAAAAGTPAAGVPAPAPEVAGVNDRVELARAARELGRRVAERHMREGVSILDPGSTWIEEGVEIGADTVIDPQVHLGAGTVVGTRCRIGQGTVIASSRLAASVTVKPYCVLEEAVVGEGATVGPFARLRPGTELGPEVHVGNFCETKKTRMGRGAKANHLSYLGDAVIGARTNIGAGTITCNYDGVDKHATVLGDGVFIGSDTQLVAPVTVGDGAYVGAGSTIVQDVPPGALALSRSPQVVKEGWVERKRRVQAAKAKGRKTAPGATAGARRRPKR